ncbi:hypothetical protein SsS58_05795 [Streptomyces scabiei]|uniref:Transposase n=1 Tax=Streptomyces scabiei TaxID=1930 RepID=A0A100JTH2_STRSC|nr:hypothetical protein SsS58_05795 [Streptomyces scabiei]
MTPPRARTWGRRGHTPVVRVRGRSWRRWSIAAMCCYRPGYSSRLIYRPRQHRKHRGAGRNSFAWTDYRDLVVRAHIQLKALPLPRTSSALVGGGVVACRDLREHDRRCCCD